MLSVRPKLSQLDFHVFSRSIHPELYNVHAARNVDRKHYSARIEITSFGHVITWNTLPPSVQSDDAENRPIDDGVQYATVCEVVSAPSQPLPGKRLLLTQPLKGSRTERVDHRQPDDQNDDPGRPPIERDAQEWYRHFVTVRQAHAL